ncbi:Gldg family protein, partial [Candidatus Roizmanbacteria bacterium]|nr:Gldg family protein [Candidatus Roizmanbacteria bacterium]
MDIQNIKTIVRKELSQYYNNVSSYVVLMVFLLLWEFLFFRSAILVGEASLRMLYDLLPWVMLLLVPAVTMGIISREKDEGTLELLLTQPITDLELIVGKWIASLIFLSSALLFAIPIAFFMSMYGAFDWGMFGGQLTGSILFAGVFASVGIFVSTLFVTQIAALLVTVFVGFLLIVIGTELVTANLPLVVVPVFERLSFLSHLSSMSRGVIDTRDVWYFISVVIMFLGLTYLLFMKRKYGNVKAKYASFQTGIALFIGIMVLTNVLGERIPGRLDLTAGRLYTLSNGTKKILKELPDVVSISLYASGRLPPQYTPVIRETKDLLRDVKTTGGDNVQVSLFDPSSNASIATEATSKGVREVQFNVIGQEEFQVKTGFMGLAVEYAGATETIPFIQQTDDLEYQLTSMIRKLTIKDKKQISFLSGHGEKELASDMQTLNTEITKLFTVTSETEVATNAAALVVAAPMQKYDSALIARMNEFINQKKNVLLLVEGYEISP